MVIGPHLSPEFGHTIREIEKDGFIIDARVECLMSSDSDVGMAKTIGVATLGIADALARMRPDILLLIADRYELLAPASVALALRIPIAHIEGGEISEGAIDDAVRHALTKMSHLHFTPTHQSGRRVKAMGEEPWRVHRCGAPSLDHLYRTTLPSLTELEAKLNRTLENSPIVVAYHPVTLERTTTLEADAVFAALEHIARAFPDHPLIFCFPNADAGSRHLVARAEAFCRQIPHAALYVNLSHLHYWRLLKQACLLIGNSSSGIMETPSLALPTVNIGKRQQGRERAANIVDTPAEQEAIVNAVAKALSPAFRNGLAGMTNPYGDGKAGERIAQILAEAPPAEVLLHKKALPLSQNDPPCFQFPEDLC